MTLRCLEDDLEVPGELVFSDARHFAEHPAVKKFVDMRGSAPGKGEPIHGDWPYGQLCSLHVGGGRAVTLWDESTDVCWLLGYDAFHRIGHPDDAYNVFASLYAAGALLPTEEDYLAALQDEEQTFRDELSETGAVLLAQARAAPGTEAVKTYTDGGEQVICVDVLIEGNSGAEQGWLGLTLPRDEQLGDVEVYEMVAELLPPDVTPLYQNTFGTRPRRAGEIVFMWDHYFEVPPPS